MCPIFDYTIRPVLFIRLLTYKKFTKCFNLKCEQNIYNRFFTGISDANNFFIEGSSEMCLYLNSYLNLKLKLEFLIRNLIFNFINNKIACLIECYKSISNDLKVESINNLLSLYKNHIFDYIIN